MGRRVGQLECKQEPVKLAIVEHDRQELVAFYQQCWQFAEF